MAASPFKTAHLAYAERIATSHCRNAAPACHAAWSPTGHRRVDPAARAAVPPASTRRPTCSRRASQVYLRSGTRAWQPPPLILANWWWRPFAQQRRHLRSQLESPRWCGGSTWSWVPGAGRPFESAGPWTQHAVPAPLAASAFRCCRPQAGPCGPGAAQRSGPTTTNASARLDPLRLDQQEVPGNGRHAVPAPLAAAAAAAAGHRLDPAAQAARKHPGPPPRTPRPAWIRPGWSRSAWTRSAWTRSAGVAQPNALPRCARWAPLAMPPTSHPIRPARDRQWQVTHRACLNSTAGV